MTIARQLGISVLAAPLASIDRRGLSQAWYSALHLARDAENAGAPAARANGPGAPPHAPAHRSAPEGRPAARAASEPAARAAHAPSARAGIAIERRQPRLPLARRIERALLAPRVRAARASFALGAGDARVVVLLHGAGDRVRLIALCSRASCGTVARALEQARFALAARGIALDAAVRGARRCF
jgi:hypothetical protein